MELVAFPEEQIVEFLVNKLDMNQVTIQVSEIHSVSW
jgi:hypothetical protein